MKKSILLLTASLCAVCAISLAGCGTGGNGKSSVTQEQRAITLEENDGVEKPEEGCPDCKPDGNGDCKDGDCGKKRMPRVKRGRNKRPTSDNCNGDDCNDGCKDGDCKDGETRESGEEHCPRNRRRRGHGRRLPPPADPDKGVDTKKAD